MDFVRRDLATKPGHKLTKLYPQFFLQDCMSKLYSLDEMNILEHNFGGFFQVIRKCQSISMSELLFKPDFIFQVNSLAD